MTARNRALTATGVGLTNKQLRFVEEYLVDLNTTDAARRAGYSAKTAGVIGYENLTKPHIAAEIQGAMNRRSERVEITADRVLKELAKIGFSSLRDMVAWGPQGVTMKPSDELTPEQAACVAEVSQTVTEHGGTTRFKLHDKATALSKIALHLGMFKNQVDANWQVTTIHDPGRDKLSDAQLAELIALAEAAAGEKKLLGS